MSWTSLDEDDATSSSDEERDVGKPADVLGRHLNRLDKSERKFDGARCSGAEKPRGYSSQEQSNSCNPYIQEPNSDNETSSRKVCRTLDRLRNVESLLSAKDERIHVLEKLVNGQREQLYHFLNLSMKEETLLELKKTCRATEALNRNESMSMALDKFKHENNLPTEQTLVRKTVSRTLLKIERLMRHQVRLVKAMESFRSGADNDEELHEDCDKSVEIISCYRSDDQLTDVQKLLNGTRYVKREIHVLKIQLKKLALIEEERIDLVERVYSMPADQRQYYAHLAIIEREKLQLLSDIDKLKENYRDLKQKCSLLEETEVELNRSIDAKVADIDLNQIKPGLEKHLELMDMVERGEVSLIKMSKDENGKFKNDFLKLYNENSGSSIEISKLLKDFDELTNERDNLKRQNETLLENSIRLQSEIKSLRSANKRDDLIEELRKVCLEREQLRTKLERVTKDVPGMLKSRDETLVKITEERDQLRLKLAGYLGVEKDVKSLRLKASQCEAYQNEAERLRSSVSELEDQVKTAQIALLDMNAKNPLDLANVSRQFEHLRKVEEEKERLAIEISRYKYALLRQENEVKDLVNTVDKLIERIKMMESKNSAVNPAEGTPEGPDITPALNSEEEKRLDMIRRRVNGRDASRTLDEPAPDEKITMENNVGDKDQTIIGSIKILLSPGFNCH